MGDEVAKIEPIDPPETGRSLRFVGVAITLVWLGLIVIYLTMNWSKFIDLAPNAVGDFLAGAFAPLAFFWLVLGFFQQGAELRNSGKALWLQGRELQNSVEQQKQLVNVSRDQLKIELDRLAAESDRLVAEGTRRKKAMEPKLDLSLRWSASRNDSEYEQAFSLGNHGETCTRLIAKYGDVELCRRDALAKGERQEFSMVLPVADTEIDVLVSYLDIDREPGEIGFRIIRSDGNTDVRSL